MRFDVLTLFPELFPPFLSHGVTRRAFDSGQISVHVHLIRDFADGGYRRVDDRPFGGGPGMVMMAEPLARCLDAVRQQRGDQAPVVLFSPAGRRLDQAAVQRWSAGQGAILVCGRYEGVDQRFIEACVSEQISLGDFVLSGGEIAAMALMDSVARLQGGVLNSPASHQQDSFGSELDGLLDCPHYTRPPDWRGRAVPEVLLSGDHARISAWRRETSLAHTAQLRPDLITRARQAGSLKPADEAVLGSLPLSGSTRA
ncbi:MAG: tRNA (guanosine(37)-N1)-methyltransferase TrmD [Rhodoferax sp.]|nr:tRNA (guanosine(37)-N1)-methyltransferase TrmD [Rhodoferax sp.]